MIEKLTADEINYILSDIKATCQQLDICIGCPYASKPRGLCKFRGGFPENWQFDKPEGKEGDQDDQSK